jgi:hypothetical protein
MIKDFWTEDEIEISAEEYDRMKGQIVTSRLK